jgi:hypothetical protein
MGAITGIGNLDEKDNKIYVPYVPPPPPPNTDSLGKNDDNSLQGVVVSQNSSGDTYQHIPSIETGLYKENSKI